MGSERRRVIRLIALGGGLFLCASVFGWATAHAGTVFIRLAAIAAGVAVLWAIWHEARASERQLLHFVEALQRGETFDGTPGKNDSVSRDALVGALRQWTTRLHQQEIDAGGARVTAEAMLDAAPAALILVLDDDRIELLNRASRALFARIEGHRLDEMGAYGPTFVAALRSEPPGKRIIELLFDEVPCRAMLTIELMTHREMTLRIVSIQTIQTELDAAEIAVQADLVRVLSHEILNSLTPVTSLAGTAAMLMQEPGDEQSLSRARRAIDTLANRAASLLRFVESYRTFATTPEIVKERFPAEPWIEDLVALFTASPAGQTVDISLLVDSPERTIEADKDLLGQVVLNLMKNGAEAADQTPRPALEIGISQDIRGRTRISVRDNGTGIPAELGDDIFLPFFTTRKGGSGIGLNLARRIVLGHGGTLRSRPVDVGTCFEIVM